MHRELKKTRREEKGEEGKEELEQGKRWRIVDGREEDQWCRV